MRRCPGLPLARHFGSGRGGGGRGRAEAHTPTERLSLSEGDRPKPCRRMAKGKPASGMSLPDRVKASRAGPFRTEKEAAPCTTTGCGRALRTPPAKRHRAYGPADGGREGGGVGVLHPPRSAPHPPGPFCGLRPLRRMGLAVHRP